MTIVLSCGQAAWLEEMMFIVILCHAAPVPIIVTVILNQTVTVFFWSRILSGSFDEESAKAIDYSLAHLFVLCMDLKKRVDSGPRNLQESVRTWQSFVL